MSCVRGCCPDQLSHYRSIGISASAMPTRSSPRVAQLEAKEKRWTQDFAAVKALKKEGIVPRSSDGAADLVARAETRYEIERGKTIPAEKRKRLAEITGQEIR